MDEYKVVSITEWWTLKRLAKKTEDALNHNLMQGWKVEYIKKRVWALYNTMLFLKRKIEKK